MKKTLGLKEVPMVILEYILRLRQRIIENRVNLYYVGQRIFGNKERKAQGGSGGGSNHHMDEKKQIKKKKRKMKRQFKNSEEIDKAEMKLKLDEEQDDIEESGRG